MGVIKHFSSDSRDYKEYKPQEIKIIKEVRVNSTPDPTNFVLKRLENINGYPILLVNYPGVQNYEGNKILMYPKNFDLSVLKNRIDPHFFTNGDSPIARFEPTAYGWKLARTLAKNL